MRRVVPVLPVLRVNNVRIVVPVLPFFGRIREVERDNEARSILHLW